jgi:hypothetical protein
MNDKKILSVQDRLDLRAMIGEKAGRLLETFYEENLLCWLDSGSLLGVVRNNKFNAWEKDVDLGIFFDDFHRAMKISKEFAKKENVRFKLKVLRGVPYKLAYKYKDKTGAKKQLPFDIHIFFKFDGTAWSSQASNLLKKGSNLPDAMYNNFREKNSGSFPFFRFAAANPLYAFCVLLRKAGLRAPINALMIFNQGLNMIFDRAYHNANSYIFRLFFKIYDWRVPLSFFESAKPLPSMPPHLIVPQPIDGYLAARYGEDWKVPRSKWFYILDDGCIFPGERETYRKAEMLYKQSRAD